MATRIMVCLDGSQLAEQALPHAMALGQETELILVQVPEPLSPRFAKELAVSLTAQVEKNLEATAQKLIERGFKARWRVGSGHVVESILALAKEEEPDLLVICSHGRSGIRRWLIGSVAERVVRSSLTPVLLVRPTLHGPGWEKAELPRYRTALIPLDGSPFAASVLPFATVVPIRPEKITLVQASDVPVFIGRELLDAEIFREVIQESDHYLAETAKSPELAGYEVDWQACDAMADEAILGLAEERKVDLIIMATHGRKGLDRWSFGSVAEKVARASTCPLLLFSPGCMTPAKV